MSTPRALLVDIDGVLVVSWEALPGAVDALARIRESGVAVRFLTNTTSRTRAGITAALRRVGFDVTPDEVLTATAATRSYLERQHPGARCLLLNSGDVADDLAGVRLAAPYDALHDGPSDARPEEVDVVVLGGAGPEFTYEALNRALVCLLEGAALVAMHRNLLWRTRSGMQLDTGAYLAGLERAAGVEAVVMGKPAPAMFEAALDSLGRGAGEVAMVGDDLDTDVRAAQVLGITGIQVRTGKFRSDRLERPDGGAPPDVILGSISDVPGWLARGRE